MKYLQKYQRMTAIVSRERGFELCKEFITDRPRFSAWFDFMVMQEILLAYDGKKSVEELADEHGISPGKLYDALANRHLYKEL